MVAIIVAGAVVSLYRHLRQLVGSSAHDAPASCHGCDDCDTESESDAAAPSQPDSAPLHPQSTRVH